MTGAWQGQTRVRRERRLTKVLLIAAALVFFCGLFGQIALRAQLSGQNKQLASLEKEIQALSANAANLDLSINQRHNLDEIGRKAILLGMEQPDESSCGWSVCPRPMEKLPRRPSSTTVEKRKSADFS